MKVKLVSKASLSTVILVSAAVALAGCTQVKKSPPATPKSTEPYRVEDEGKVPPLAPADVRKEVDREEAYEDLPVTEEPVSVEAVEPAPPPPPPATRADSASAPAERKTMDGYRIQLFASSAEDAARSVKEAAEVRLSVPAYVEFIDGIYKVRVGDCPTREDAERLLATCRQAGYRDAWITAGKIYLPARREP